MKIVSRRKIPKNMFKNRHKYGLGHTRTFLTAMIPEPNGKIYYAIYNNYYFDTKNKKSVPFLFKYVDQNVIYNPILTNDEPLFREIISTTFDLTITDKFSCERCGRNFKEINSNCNICRTFIRHLSKYINKEKSGRRFFLCNDCKDKFEEDIESFSDNVTNHLLHTQELILKYRQEKKKELKQKIDEEVNLFIEKNSSGYHPEESTKDR